MIESLQNDKIKHLIRLSSDNRYRKKNKVFIVEGIQENQRALQFDFENVEFYICETLYNGTIPSGKIHWLSEKVYEKVAYRGSSEGIIGVYKTKNSDLNTFQPKSNATIIAIEGIEKPGNLGAILRSCEAFGIDALVICDGKTDLYNPNVIRSSVGCLFGMTVFQTSNEDFLAFLKKHQFQIFTTIMSEDASPIHQKDFNKKSALLFGTEHSGLSNFWKEKGENTLIPMAGTIDSLNLSNAVAIGCYEVLRQKIIT